MEKDKPSNVLLVFFELLLAVVVNTGRLIIVLGVEVYRVLWRRKGSSSKLVTDPTSSDSNEN
jgi:hypothetical protein